MVREQQGQHYKYLCRGAEGIQQPQSWAQETWSTVPSTPGRTTDTQDDTEYGHSPRGRQGGGTCRSWKALAWLPTPHAEPEPGISGWDVAASH
jgi:hypothetical protein